jgi:Ca2+-binding EF-hand superfamily protein
MHRRSIVAVIILITSALVATCAAFAQNPNRRGREGDPNGDKGPSAEEIFLKQTEFSFKVRDRNGDGYLDKDEMPAEIRNNLAMYDKDGDGRISFDEYLEYRILTQAGFPMPGDKAGKPAPPVPMVPEVPAMQEKPATPPRVIIVDDDELERRPTVYRAGNLPKGMPSWFALLDTNADGQVALWEWRKGGKSLGEFAMWDRNHDGFITVEEVLYKLEQERLIAERGGKALPVGAGLEFRATMIHGSVTNYLIKFEKGKTYQIDMFTESPQPLNPYLFLLDVKAKVLMQDDDSGGNLNARIIYKAAEARDVWVIASSSGKAGVGDYVVTVKLKE